MSPVPPSGFPREAIESCLDRIGASPHFSRSRRLSRFLRYAVEALLEGRANEIKERTIGVEVYGRSLEYDTRSDPIVRSEAHRLRTRLAAYYAQEGAADPLVIEFPRGSYVPELHPNRALAEFGSQVCRLIVARFEDRSSDRSAADQAVALERALRTRLARRPGLRVVDPSKETFDSSSSGAHLAADYRVEGSFGGGSEARAVTVHLVRIADERQVWSETELFTWERSHQVEEARTEHLAASIGAALTRRTPLHPTQYGRAYELYVKARHSAIQYANTFDPRELESARRRLRGALEQEPEYVEALAELAHLELLRLYPPRGNTAHILASARALLDRSLDAEPRHPRSLYLLGHVEGTALHPREALRLTESAVAADPNDPEGRIMLGLRYAALGFWEAALAACDWAVALDPVWDAAYRTRIYLLTRTGRVAAARRAIDELARLGASPPIEFAIARFDLWVAQGDVAGARAALSSHESTLPWNSDQEDRWEIACALGAALNGQREDAARTLATHRDDGPRFWDHLIRLALVLGEEELALELLRGNAINGSYRWLVSEPLARPYLHRPSWRVHLDDLHARWRRDLAEVGPRLPAPPPTLPEPADLGRSAGVASTRGASLRA